MIGECNSLKEDIVSGNELIHTYFSISYVVSSELVSEWVWMLVSYYK